MTRPARSPSLWLLRHAQPLIASGVCYGQLDVPADPSDTLQSALRFANAAPAQAPVRHSPLMRCTQLAQALHTNGPVAIEDARLQEMHFGSWEGQTWSDIGREQVDAWSSQLYAHAPGNGESLATMLARVRSALIDSWQRDSLHGQHDVVWVTHAGVIRCVHWLLRYGWAQPQAADWQLPAPGFGQWHCLPWASHAVALQALA